MSTLHRIKKFIDYKNITVKDFEIKVGFSNGAFGSQLRNNKTIGVDKLENILLVYSEINPEWLLTGKGSMLKSEVPICKGEPVNKGIPLLPYDAFAGLGDTEISGIPFESIEEQYHIPLFKDIKIDFMLSVRGSSMYPKYSSGDVVACRLITELVFIQWNKVYVIDTLTQGIIMKRLKKCDNNNCVVCKSDNPNYDEFTLPKKEIRNIALVVGVVRLE